MNNKCILFSSNFSTYKHMLAGMTAGITSTLLFHPLDLVKIRFAGIKYLYNNDFNINQVNDGIVIQREYHGVWNAFSTIIKREGFSGLYKGVAPNMISAASGWGCYFFFYNSIRTPLVEYHKKLNEIPRITSHLTASSTAGILTLIITNPITVVKTRLCLQYDTVTNQLLPHHKQYHGMCDAFSKMLRYEGITGLYKGFVPGMCGVIHGAIQFVAYEQLKTKCNLYKSLPYDTHLSIHEYLFCAALSKIFSAIVTYPYQVIRTRLQDQYHVDKGVMEVIHKIVRNEGAYGFYKGLTPYLCHVTPNVCLIFLIYEAFQL